MKNYIEKCAIELAKYIIAHNTTAHLTRVFRQVYNQPPRGFRRAYISTK